MKKLLRMAMIAFIAAVSMIAAPCTQKAETETIGTGVLSEAGIESVSVNNVVGILSVRLKQTTKELLVGLGKVNTKNGTITIPSWDSYSFRSGYGKVQLTKLDRTKDNYVVLSAPGKGISIIKISASPRYIKAKFDAAKGILKIGSGNKASDIVLREPGFFDYPRESYYYRTQYGIHHGRFDYEQYQEHGTVLYICRDGYVTEDLSDTTVRKLPEVYTYGETKAQVYDGGMLRSKEIKVAIPAKPKGPKIVADYTKGTIRFPKNCEYRLAGDGKLQAAGSDGKYTPGPTTATAIADIAKTDAVQFGSAATFDLEARTVASEKRPASKWSRLSIVRPAVLGNTLLDTTNSMVQDGLKTNGKLPAQGDTDKEGGGKGVKLAKVKESTDSGAASVLAMEYVAQGKIDGSKYYTANAFVIENSGEKTYEIVIGDTTAGVKATKIAPNKKVVFGNIADGSIVWIRAAGDNKKQMWVGEYAKLGIIDFPFQVPKKES